MGARTRPHERPPQPDLDTLPKAALKAEWETCFGHPPPARIRRDFLIRNLAWQRQAAQHGGLSKKAERQLRQLAAAFRKDPNYQPPVSRPPIKPGTRLLREWQGEVHEVIVAEHGYRYRDTPYKSLSVIARHITGTRWSGPAFFGLNRPHRQARR